MIGFSPQSGVLRGLYDAQPTSGDFTPGQGLSIATRTNDIATTASGWAGASGIMKGPGGKGGTSASLGVPGMGSGFDTAMDIGGAAPYTGFGMGNLSNPLGPTDEPGRMKKVGASSGGSRKMSEEGTGTGLPIITIVLVVVGAWIAIHVYRTMRGHDGAMRGGATFFIVDVPLIVAAIWGWRWLTGVGVQHNVPYSASAAAFFTPGS